MKKFLLSFMAVTMAAMNVLAQSSEPEAQSYVMTGKNVNPNN